MDGTALRYVNNRLNNKKTEYDWENKLMGSLKDYNGLEQGGIFSSELYKINNNE